MNQHVPGHIDRATIRAFLTIISERAQAALKGANDPGYLQLVRIHPDAETDTVAELFELDDIDGMADVAFEDASHGHNVYVEGRTVSGTRRGRGKTADTRGVFAFVADADADKGKAGKMPIEPSMIVETSPGNCHHWIFLERALTPDQGRKGGLAARRAHRS